MLAQSQRFDEINRFEYEINQRLCQDVFDPTKFSITTGDDAVLDDVFSYQVYNKNKNHWRGSSAPADPVAGMLFSDSDDDELYHYDGASWNQVGITDHGALTGLADDDHTQYHNNTRGDARYFQQSEHIDSSAGAGDAGKPIKLNASGYVDGSMVSAGAVDHGSLSGLADNDHPQYYMPVGAIVAIIGGYFTDGSNGGYTNVTWSANTVAGCNGYIDSQWRVCNGASLNDADSPIWVGAGRYLPKLTDDRFIMGDTTAGGTGGSSTMNHTHSCNPPNTTSGAGTAHSHGSSSGTTGAGSAHSHADTFATGNESSHTHSDTFATGNESSHTHSFSDTSTTNSVGHTHGLNSHTHSMQSHTHTISNIGHTHTGVQGGADTSNSADGCSSPTGGPSTANTGVPSPTATSGVSASHTHNVSGTTGTGSSHNHSVTGAVGAGTAHNHSITGSVSNESAHTHSYDEHDQTESSHTHDVNIASFTSGSASVTENRPKYLGCLYIVKVK